MEAEHITEAIHQHLSGIHQYVIEESISRQFPQLMEADCLSHKQEGLRFENSFASGKQLLPVFRQEKTETP